jgi:hypothetical protein
MPTTISIDETLGWGLIEASFFYYQHFDFERWYILPVFALLVNFCNYWLYNLQINSSNFSHNLPYVAQFSSI